MCPRRPARHGLVALGSAKTIRSEVWPATAAAAAASPTLRCVFGLAVAAGGGGRRIRRKPRSTYRKTISPHPLGVVCVFPLRHGSSEGKTSLPVSRCRC